MRSRITVKTILLFGLLFMVSAGQATAVLAGNGMWSSIWPDTPG